MNIPMQSLWKIVVYITTDAMTSKVTYYVMIDGSDDFPNHEAIAWRATGGLAQRVVLESMSKVGAGVAFDTDDGSFIVCAGDNQ